MQIKKIIIIILITILTGGVFLSSVAITRAGEGGGLQEMLPMADLSYKPALRGGGKAATEVLKEIPVLTNKGPFDDIGAALSRIFFYIRYNIELAALESGTIAYKNSLRYFLNKVAYDTATYLATGDKGKKPLFITEGWTKYFQKVGDEAVGDFFYRLGKEVWKKNLCEPWNPLTKIDITVAAKKASEPKVSSVCTWVQIKKNIKDLKDLKFNQLVKLSDHFLPNSNELGVYMDLRTLGYSDRLKKEKEDNLVRIINGAFKDVVNPITGAIKTPASIIDNAINTSFSQTFSDKTTYTGSPVADAIGTFTNTLVSKYLEKIFKKGFNPGGVAVVSDFWSLGGIQAARLFFNDLAQPDYKFNTGMDLFELSSEGEGQFNAVISDKFVRAVEQKCTLGQAMGYYGKDSSLYKEECWDGSRPLIDPVMILGYESKDVEPKIDDGLPYRSLLVLRKFRIIPVGWELAAEYYNKLAVNEYSPERFTLQYAVGEFSNIESPYYGLVDPDWLLKFPVTRCNKEGAGPRILSRVFAYCMDVTKNSETTCEPTDRIYVLIRLDYCADYETCLDDRGGNCAQSDYGYCLEEKPIWNIKGDICREKYYASCQTLTIDGDESTKPVSYLLNTLSGKDICNEKNSGCREYCTEAVKPFEESSWICNLDSGNKIYLNSNAKDCPSSADGCSLIYRSSSKDPVEVQTSFDAQNYVPLEKKYLKLAPAHYSCDDYTTKVPDIDSKDSCPSSNFWRTDLNICVQSGSRECANYVKMCTVDDVSCKLYTPQSGSDPAVPAIISDGDLCPVECAGYKNYYQDKTNFEAGKDVSLIANTGKTCSVPGCDQFTNLDEVAKGGEGIEYFSYLRQCVKPDSNDANQKTYYTWEGSDTSGYQLKKWTLLTDGINISGDTCDDLTDSDCREFFDSNLNSTKIYYSSVIIVTDDCHPYRKTISTSADCSNSNGSWEGGSCIYFSIPSLNKSCGAGNNLCREYKSNKSYNYEKLITSNFSKVNDLGGWTDGTISNESLKRNDYSLKISTSISHQLELGDLETGKTYSLDFMAKGSGSLSVKFSGGSEEVAGASAALNADWTFYSIKLPDNNLGLTETQAQNNAIIITGQGFIDNIVLKKMEQLYLIKDSWVTPSTCDGYEGCEHYQDSDKNDVYLKSFDKFCFEDVVGCEKVINTNNYLTDTSKHGIEFLVPDTKYACSEATLGCSKLGLMAPNRKNDTDPVSYNFTNVYKTFNPEATNEQCLVGEVFCQSYVDEENKIYYFKDPTYFTCEFRNNDWFKSGTNEKCNIDAADPFDNFNDAEKDGYCLGGVRKDGAGFDCDSDENCTNLSNPSSPGVCTAWVGLCTENSSGCREYQDPQKPENCNKSLVNYAEKYDPSLPKNSVCDYYYYKNTDICSEGVNPNNGCAAFNSTINPEKNLRSGKICTDKDPATTDSGKACEVNADCLAKEQCLYTNTISE